MLTNAHVVTGSERVLVLLGESQHDATVVRRDEERDVALLKLEGILGAAPLAITRTQPREGDAIYVIGTPIEERLQRSVTSGVLSGRPEFDRKTLLQTDAALNAGNSGDPALDERGEVIGISVAKYIKRDAEKIHFLIPIAEALNALRIERGH